jgi:hypothetical protein
MPATPLDLSSEQRTTFVVEEYKALREEILTAIRAQLDVLRFGTAVLVVLLSAAGAAVKERPLLAAVAFVFVPAVSAMTLTMWSAEMFRMMRAAVYIHTLEDDLRTLANGKVVLAWEHTAHRTQDPDVEAAHAWTIRIGFAVVSLASLGFGMYLLWHGDAHAGSAVRIALTVGAAAATIASMGVLLKMAHDRYKLCEPYRTAKW